jgi:hypothetical protein
MKWFGFMIGGTFIFFVGHSIYYKYLFKRLVTPLEYRLYVLNRKIKEASTRAKKSLVQLKIEK